MQTITSAGIDPVVGRGQQIPPVPGTESLLPSDSNFLSNIVLEIGSTGFVEGLVRLQAEAAADDFLLDLGGAADTLQSLIMQLSAPRYASAQYVIRMPLEKTFSVGDHQNR